jgi:crotonobetainyl-CoA:carnitine CoA-transferase CaiB-like acyl-CoA transferase
MERCVDSLILAGAEPLPVASSPPGTLARPEFQPLAGIQVVTLAANAPGPVAAARLRDLGASVKKVEAPGGDPMSRIAPEWYRSLTAGQEVIRLDLKAADGRQRLESLLGNSDLLLTASRPAALERLSLGWSQLEARHPHLSQVAIVGYPPPSDNIPGHDLTYLAGLGLLTPPHLPRTVVADLAGAEMAVSACLALLLAQTRSQHGRRYTQVSLAAAASSLAEPLRQGVTAPGGILGGGSPGYNLYRTSRGWIAVAALEPHFWRRLLEELGLREADHGALERAFSERSAEDWESWALKRDLPIKALHPTPPTALHDDSDQE